jgi:hypothetical protein
MELNSLKDYTVKRAVEYRTGHGFTLEIAPDAESTTDDNTQFIIDKLRSWDLTLDGKPLPITVETLENRSLISATLYTVILDAIASEQQAPLGKLTTVKHYLNG